ncbi:MAG: hypothetical protein ABI759_12860 [Candidatus Solibacter sp.]
MPLDLVGSLTTPQVLKRFRPRFPFFTRDLLYYFIKQGYITFTTVTPKGRTLAVRTFDAEAIAALEALLISYEQRRAAQSQIQELRAATAGPEDTRPAVLIVEDETQHQELLAAELEEAFDVHIAASTEEALEALEGPVVFRAAVVDLALPPVRGERFVLMGGKDVVAAARARGVPCVVVLSARISPILAAEFALAGVPQFTKPAKASKVGALLQESCLPQAEKRRSSGGTQS